MAIKQLTVFIQNKKGTVVSVTDILSKNNINLRALSIAETQDFGILRLIVNDEKAAEAVLEENGYKVKHAVLNILYEMDFKEADQALKDNHGILRRIVEKHRI